MRGGGYGYRELVLRVNGIDTPWAAGDLAAASDLAIDAVLLPKVESLRAGVCLRAAHWSERAAKLPLWVMIETPRGVLGIEHILAGNSRIEVVVHGHQRSGQGIARAPYRRPSCRCCRRLRNACW